MSNFYTFGFLNGRRRGRMKHHLVELAIPAVRNCRLLRLEAVPHFERFFWLISFKELDIRLPRNFIPTIRALLITTQRADAEKDKTH